MNIARHSSQPDELVEVFDCVRPLVCTLGCATGTATGIGTGAGIRAAIGGVAGTLGTGACVVVGATRTGAAVCAALVGLCKPMIATMPNSAVVEIPAVKTFEVCAGVGRFDPFG